MLLLKRLIAGIAPLLRGRRAEQELDDELRAYLDASSAEKIRAGMSPEAARRAARAEMGSLEAIKDHTRDVGWETTLESVWRDLQYAVRMLRHAPVFSAVAILTLALGIGANVGVFTLVDAVLFRPLPFHEPDRLVMISESHIESGQQRVGVLPGSLLDWRERSRSFEGISVLWAGPMLITNRAEAARIQGAHVSPNFFRLIGVEPFLGRVFPATESEMAGHEREVVISHGLWQRWFGSDTAVLGQTLEVQGWVRLTIVGVMPPDFSFPRGAEIWGPEPWDRSMGRGDRWRQAIGRIRSDVPVDAASRDLQQIGEQLAREFSATNAGWTPTVDRLDDAIVGSVRPPLALLLGAVAVVLLIACVNVATLVLLRSTGRRRELAMRAALGAQRARLARQSFIEYALLAAVGALAGGVLAGLFVDGLVALAPAAIPRLDAVAVDVRVLAYLMLVAVATMIITGAVPALRSPRIDASAVLRGGAGASPPGLAARGLVIAEVALAVTLLAGAGLMVRTMVNLQRLDLGFEPSGIITTDLRVPTSRMTEGPARVGARPAWDQLALFYGELVQQIEAMPGVQGAAAVAAPSLVGRDAVWFARPGIFPPRAVNSSDWRPVQHRVVTPAYFEVLRLPLVRGRLFTQQDHALEFLRSGTGRRRGTAIVNRVVAQQFWPGEDALGQALTIEGDWRVDGRIVVGIAGDSRDLAPDLEPQPTIYVPFAETPDFGATLLVRVTGTRPQLPDIRTRLRNFDRSLAIGEIRPLVDSYAATQAPRRFITIILLAFAGTGLLMGGIGLYGLIATSVAQRTREFGIRVALGATWETIRNMVLREAGLVVGIGAALGMTGAVAATGLIRSQLFGVVALDAPAWTVTGVILGAAGLAAAWLPARRAASVDPALTLRVE
jgi:predicted permease